MKKRLLQLSQTPNQDGQALLTILIFMSIGITMLTAATIVLVTNIYGTTASEQGLAAYYAAESGAEDGYLHILRNPSYSGTLPSYAIGDGQAVVSIANGVITSTGTYGNAVRKIQIQSVNTNGVFSISSWKEIN